jgi:PAT family beta-lactamase induction signal transducer AmpG
VIWPLVITMHTPNLLYVWASLTRVGLVAVGCITAAEQFAYGFGFSAFMVALMDRCRGSAFPTSSYAISSGLMALSALAAGAASGFLVDALGYTGFFVAVCLSAIPGMLVVLAWRPVATE